jgi:hypothetical protein
VRSNGGQGRGGRQRPEQERVADGVGEDAADGFIWGKMEKKRKKKIEIEKFTKKSPILSYVSSFDRFSVPHQS